MPNDDKRLLDARFNLWYKSVQQAIVYRTPSPAWDSITESLFILARLGKLGDPPKFPSSMPWLDKIWKQRGLKVKRPLFSRIKHALRAAISFLRRQ